MKKKKIAILANGWNNEYIYQVLEGIKEEAAKDGVDIFVFLTYIYWGELSLQSKCQLNIYHLPNPKDYDGAIVLSNTFNLPDEHERALALFKRKNVPMVCTEVRMPDVAIVGTSNTKGMKELAKHLVVEHGVKSVVYVSGIQGNEECAQRKSALLEVLSEHGLSLLDEYRGDFGFYGASTNTLRYLDEGGVLPDAFVCANDHMAIGVIDALRKRGIRVPEDTLVTGFDHIDESKNAYPMIATVSKKGEELGKEAYIELKNQIECQDSTVCKIFDSEFISSESCGCKPTEEELENRLNILRTGYSRNNEKNMNDLILQNLRTSMSKVDTKEGFNARANDTFYNVSYMGEDFCICTEPLFFETDDDNYPQRIRGYSKTMDVIYSKVNNQSQPLYSFKTKELYPGYKKEPGKSNVYLFAPINHLDYIIGYFAVKNNTKIIFDMSLKKWLGEMNTLFITIRNYIFAQQTNKKLKQIYMTDFLTGINNRTGCEKILFQFIEDEKKARRSSILLFADIDCMKTINDVYGHLNGDLAIKATADAMKESLPDSWMLGRYGGDEFIAVGPCLNDDFAKTIRDNLSSSMKKVISGLKISFNLTVSVGYTIIHPEDEGDVEEYIRQADAYMYEEKKKAHKALGVE